MHLPNLAGVGPLLSRIFKPRKRTPADGPPPGEDTSIADALTALGIGGTQSLTPPPQAREPFKPQRSPEIDNLNQLVQEALGALRAPAPKLQQPEPNMFEALAGLYGATQLKGPAIQTALEAPFKLATARTALHNAPLIADWENKRNAAETTLKFAGPTLNAYLDRDAAVDRVWQALEVQHIKTEAARLAANAKQDSVLHTKIAESIEKGTATETAIMEHALASGMSADVAQQYAQELFKSIQSDPQGWNQRIQTAKLALSQTRITDRRVNELRKIAKDSRGVQAGDRLSAMLELQEMGDPLYANMTFAEMKERAQGLSLDAENIQSQIKNRDARLERYVNAELPMKMDLWGQQIESSKQRVQIAWTNAQTARGALGVRAQGELLGSLDSLRIAYSGSRDAALQELGAIERELKDLREDLQRASNMGDQGKELYASAQAAIGVLTARQNELRTKAANYQSAIDLVASDIANAGAQVGTAQPPVARGAPPPMQGNLGGGTNPVIIDPQLVPSGKPKPKPKPKPESETTPVKRAFDVVSGAVKTATKRASADLPAIRAADIQAAKEVLAKVGRDSAAGKRIRNDIFNRYGVRL